MLNTINSKLIITISLVTVLIFGILSYMFINHQNQQLLSEVLRGANTFSETVTKSTRYDMLIDNREGVHRMIETIGNQPGIEKVRIFNKEGEIMFSTNKKEMGKFVDKKAEACYICHAEEKPIERLSTTERSRIFETESHRILAMVTPIYNEPDCYTSSCHIHPKEQRVLGVLDIGMSLADVDDDLSRNQIMLIFFTFIAIICVSLISSYIIHHLVTKPVKNLVGATKEIAMGNLDVNISVKTHDEISYLAKSFNRMTVDLKKSNEKIKSWNIELEKKVEERTNKLEIAKEQLIQSEKMSSMGVLASSIAHEINNPLQGILTYIKLMLKIVTADKVDQNKLDNFKEYLDLMGNEIGRCGDMVKNLLVFSRQSKLDVRLADLNSIIKNCLLLMGNKIKLQNIKVDLNLHENIPKICCDFKQIQQTLMAIIINATEAMPDGGTIKINTLCVNSNVEIDISDTGIGISDENLKNIFDPFFTTKEDSKSTGLGLFVSYGIIKEHKGTINVKSEIGKGTIFKITLPVKEIK